MKGKSFSISDGGAANGRITRNANDLAMDLKRGKKKQKKTLDLMGVL